MADVKDSLVQLTYPAGPWIEETRVKLGQGHYGAVNEVKVYGLQCAGKKYNVSLFEDSADEGSLTGKKFVEQCQQLAQVRHPNVVQLLGVFFDSKSAPTLVSELLPLNLAKCLEDYQHIPKYAKSSILLDVANGLQYVHAQKRPMVHGRLSAEKILLTISLQAKICGFINPSGAVPQDSSYTPPEAAGGSLTIKGDVFSFGNLVLHTVSQNYPLPTEKVTPDPDDSNQTISCSEVDRRKHSLKELGENHPLQGLVKRCLEDEPSSRPETGEVLREVEQYAVSTPPPYASVLQVMQEVEQMAMLKDNIAALTQTIEGKQAELDAKQLEVDGLMQELAVSEKVVIACKEEVDTYKQTVQSKERRMQMHDQALRAKDSLIKAKARELVAKNQQLTAKEAQLAASHRRISTLEERLATGRASGRGMRFPTSPQRSPVVTRSQQVSPTFKESPYKFPQSAEAEDLAVKAGEVLRRSVPGRRGKPVPMSDGIFFHNKIDFQKPGQQQVDPKLAAILAKRHQQYEDMDSSSSEAPKHLEPSQQTKGKETTRHSNYDQSPLREHQRLRSGSANRDMSPELQKMMEKRRSLMDVEPVEPPVPQQGPEPQKKTPPPVLKKPPAMQKEPEPPVLQKEPEPEPPVEPELQQKQDPPIEQKEPEPPMVSQQEPEPPLEQKEPEFEQEQEPPTEQKEPEPPTSQHEPEPPLEQKEPELEQEQEPPTEQKEPEPEPSVLQQEPETPLEPELQQKHEPLTEQNEPEPPVSQQEPLKQKETELEQKQEPPTEQKEPEPPVSQQEPEPPLEPQLQQEQEPTVEPQQSESPVLQQEPEPHQLTESTV